MIPLRDTNPTSTRPQGLAQCIFTTPVRPACEREPGHIRACREQHESAQQRLVSALKETLSDVQDRH